MRANLHGSSSELSRAVTRIQDAAVRFFKDLNGVHIDDIAVTSGDPEFELFSKCLRDLRAEIVQTIAPLALTEQFEFQNIKL